MSQGKETLLYVLDQDFDRRGRNSRVGWGGASRPVRLLLWNSEIKLLHIDLSALVLQTNDRSAVLPDGPHVSTCLLNVGESMLQAKLLRPRRLRLLQEGLRPKLCSSWQCLRQ